MVRLSETPDGPQLDREAHATVRPPALLDELAITVVQMEEALQLGSRRRSKEPPVCGYLLVGEESDRHASQLGQARRLVNELRRGRLG
jgi:hypothetical protein